MGIRGEEGNFKGMTIRSVSPTLALTLVLGALVAEGLASPLAHAQGGPSEAEANAKQVAAWLDEMGRIDVPAEFEDPQLHNEVRTALRFSRSGAGASGLRAFLRQMIEESQGREVDRRTLLRPRFQRFLQLESRVLVNRNVPVATYASALKRHADNHFFVLSVGYIGVMQHEDALVEEIIGVLNGVEPGVLALEWARLARPLARSEHIKELVPFFSAGLGLSGLELPMKEGVEFDTHEFQLVLMSALQETGEAVILKGLDSDHPVAQRAAVSLAGSLAMNRAGKNLLRIARDGRDLGARRTAAVSLASVRHFGAIPGLEKLAAAGNIPELRASALHALGEFARRRSLKTILKGVSASHVGVQSIAIEALDRFADREAVVGRLGRVASQDGNSVLRLRAVSVLSHSPLPSAAKALARIYRQEKDPKLKKVFEKALQRQSVSQARGKLLPQFNITDSEGNPVEVAPVQGASKLLRKMIMDDQAFSAREIVDLSPGLVLGDLPVLKRARRLAALEADPDVMLEEIRIISRVIRMVLDRENRARLNANG